mmetsp:Transcript_17637/g.22865  ORF Transcript_17637/g.22865 Transcript_17637/m.22865 type:complete len:85 (+) Transcript_17637:426-680(+)
MALQMKQETARIHQTVRSQTKNLACWKQSLLKMRMHVTKVTDDVNQHVQKSWTKLIGMWTFKFTMIGVFLFYIGDNLHGSKTDK